MKSKIAILSDPHFHNYKQHSTLVGGVNSRLLDISRAVREAIEKAADLGCKNLIVPGDVFHVRGTLKVGVLSHVLDLFDEMLSYHDMKALLIPGNHDMEDFNGGPHALEPLNHIKNVTVMQDGSKEVAGRLVSAIAYYPSTEMFREAYSKFSIGADIVMIHQGIDEARPSINMPETGISAAQFDKIVIAGHYHMPKLMGKVLSVGAPIQHNFGDEGQDRGFWTLDGDEFEFHKLTYPEFLTVSIDKVVDTDISKKIVKVITDDERRINDVKSLLDDTQSFSVEVLKKFVSRHEEKIRISTPLEMLTQYLSVNPKYQDHSANLVEMAKEILQ
jgi:DNA repair exonuclease SbcCD nuclease subunit